MQSMLLSSARSDLPITTKTNTTTMKQPYIVNYGGTAGIHYGDGTRFTSGQSLEPRAEYLSDMKGFRCIPLSHATEEDLRLLSNWDIDWIRDLIASSRIIEVIIPPYEGHCGVSPGHEQDAIWWSGCSYSIFQGMVTSPIVFPRSGIAVRIGGLFYPSDPSEHMEWDDGSGMFNARVSYPGRHD